MLEYPLAYPYKCYSDNHVNAKVLSVNSKVNEMCKGDFHVYRQFLLMQKTKQTLWSVTVD